jgi:hypothetical protein
MNPRFWKDLVSTFERLDVDPAVRAVVLHQGTSTRPLSRPPSSTLLARWQARDKRVLTMPPPPIFTEPIR